MVTTAQRQIRENTAFALAETGGLTCKEIAERMGVDYTTVWIWIRHKLGEGQSVKKFTTGVKRRRADILQKAFGWSYAKIGQMIDDMSRQSIYRLFRDVEPQGNPKLAARVESKFCDYFGEIVWGPYVYVMWTSDEYASVISRRTGKKHMVEWSKMIDKVSMIGWMSGGE